MSLTPKADSGSLQASGWNVTAACIQPLHNLSVTATAVILTLDLPYVEQKQVRVKYPDNQSIDVYAETRRKITFRDLGIKHRHGEFTCYHALVRIPVPVDSRKATKRFKNGLLEVRLPRRR